jgi:hypothetical protein
LKPFNGIGEEQGHFFLHRDGLLMANRRLALGYDGNAHREREEEYMARAGSPNDGKDFIDFIHDAETRTKLVEGFLDNDSSAKKLHTFFQKEGYNVSVAQCGKIADFLRKENWLDPTVRAMVRGAEKCY